MNDLKQVVVEAWKVGRGIDLATVGYGRVHWGNQRDIKDVPSPYYYFLAGLVRTLGFSRILELGTHWGGSTRAMWHGLNSPQSSKMVTVDITRESDNRLGAYPSITKIVGDANTEPVYRQIMNEFGPEGADLVFIDAAHDFMPTVISHGLYSVGLRPRYIVYDDININEGMRAAWKVIKGSVSPADTINATEVDGEIRAPSSGFGLVRLR